MSTETSKELTEYYSRLTTWATNAFLNTSSAPRNDSEWFIRKNKKVYHGRGKDGNYPCPLIVGLCGAAGSGKDSATDFLVKCLDCEKIAFADPLKQIAKIVGFTKEQLTDRKLKETPDEFWGISPRQFLQMCGTEMFRKVWRDDVWVQITHCRILELQRKTMVKELGFPKSKYGPYDIIFISDVRFPNEAEMIKEMGGLVVRVERPGNPLAIDNKHDSEKFVNEINADLVVQNTASNSEEWSWLFAKSLAMHLDRTIFYY